MSTIGRIAGRVAVIAALGVAAAALGLGVFAYVQPTEAAADMTTLAHRGGPGIGGRGACGQAGLAAAAAKLDMTVEELQTQLWGGETLSSLAEKAGVALADVQAAVNEACQAQTRAAIEQAVTDGTMTRAKADWLLEGLDKGYWGAPDAGMGFGLGRGFGPRGFGGRGDRSPLNPDTAPTATPAPGSTN